MFDLRGEVILVGEKVSACTAFRNILSNYKNLKLEAVADPEYYTWYEPEHSHRLTFVAIGNHPSDTATIPSICFHLQQTSRVALLSQEPCLDVEQAALEAGLDGAFSLRDSTQQIIKGIGAIFSGESWYRRSVLKTKIDYLLAERHRCPAPESSSGTESVYGKLLTPRELTVLVSLVDGASYKQIAEQLFISPHTVKSHVYKIFKKMKVKNRAQATCLFKDKNGKTSIFWCEDLQCRGRKTPK